MLWLRVDGCPAGCRRAAGQLQSLAEAVDAAAATLDRDARLPTETFDGLAGDAFRARSAAEAGPASSVAADTAGLARALTELAADLADVQEVMDRLAEQARPHLRVLPDRILAPEAPRAFQADEPGWAVWDRLLPVHADARRLERQAQADWAAAVAHFTGEGRNPLLLGLEWPGAYDPAVGPHL
jgi:hypothetical protein